MDYGKQAMDFLTNTGATIKIDFYKFDYHCEGDKTKRDIYTVKLTKGTRYYEFKFGTSILDSGYYMDWQTKRKINIDGTYQDSNLRVTPDFINRFCTSFGSKTPKRHGRKQPKPYDVLACLTCYDVGTFEDFCCEFGYDDDDNIKAHKIYKAVQEEYNGLCTLFNENEMLLLSEIN